jgi:fatty acid desaturase
MQEEKERHRHHMERNEKDHDEGVGEKWRRDPFSAIFFGLIVLSAGILFLLAAQGYIYWSDWWMYFLICLGSILIIETFVRWSVPVYRKPGAGRIIIGLVLIVIGTASLTAAVIWPWIIIIVALGIIIFGITRGRKPE